MTKNASNLLLLAALAMILASGCTTVGIQVPRLVPARKANLGAFKTVAVQEFEGRAPGSSGVASEMSDAVRQSLAGYERIKVLDRGRLNQVLAELRLSASDLTDASNTKKLGKILTAGALVAGKITTHQYDENLTRESSTCSRTKKVGKKLVTEKYACTIYNRKGKAQVRASIDVIDVATGATVVSDSLQAMREDSKSSVDEEPPIIDGNALLADARAEIAGEFIKDVLPHTVMVEVRFRKDGDVPALERGISYARTGDWSGAVETFREALKSALANPELDSDVLAYVHADLGLALACQGGQRQFNEAIGLLDKAFQLSNDEDYLSDKQMVKQWIEQHNKLNRQLSAEDDESPDSAG